MANDPGSSTLKPQYLPGFHAALHARNIAAKEALKLERSHATQAKHNDNPRKAQKNAKLKVKSETSNGVKQIRSEKREAALAKRLASKLSARDKNKANHLINSVKKFASQKGTRDNTSGSELSDWKQEKKRLEARVKNLSHHSDLGLRRPLQNQPTSRTATTLWDAALDSPIVSKAEIKRRWETTLLSGGTHGSVSLKQREQSLQNAPAAALSTVKSYIHKKADGMYHPTFEAHRHQDAVRLAAMQSETEADASVDAALSMIDQDVINEHLVEEGA
jgi:hypothetical protein